MILIWKSMKRSKGDRASIRAPKKLSFITQKV